PPVLCKPSGSVAGIVTQPGETQFASPVPSIVRTTVFDDFHSKPSAKCNSRLVLSVNVPVAVKPTSPCGLLGAVADEGETAMLVSLGCPAPQAMSMAAAIRSKVNGRYFIGGISSKV